MTGVQHLRAISEPAVCDCPLFREQRKQLFLHKDGKRPDDRRLAPAAAAFRCGTPAARTHSADATDNRPAARVGSAPRPLAGCAHAWLRPPCPAPAPTTAAPACKDAVA